jgi:DNA-binding MarR family transcriptional regulator
MPDITPGESQSRTHEPDLDRRPGYLAKRVSITMRSRMDATLRPLGLTVPQYVCMHALYEQPRISGAELARMALVSRQAIHQLLSELRTRGWVEQEPSANGRRRGVARLTNEGRKLIEQAFAPVDAVEDEMLSGFTNEEREELAAMLIRCEDALRAIDR